MRDSCQCGDRWELWPRGKLELRKRKGVAGLTINNVDLAGLVRDIDAGLTCDMASNDALCTGHIWRSLWRDPRADLRRDLAVLPRPRAFGARVRNSSYFAWSNSTTSDSTILPMQVTSPCATTCSSVEKVVPSGVAISCWARKNLEDRNKISLNQWKITTISKILITRERRHSSSNLLFI